MTPQYSLQYQLFPNFLGKGSNKSCFAKFIFDGSTVKKVAHLIRSESTDIHSSTLRKLTNLYEATVLSILSTFPQPEYYPKLYSFDALSLTIEYCDVTLMTLATSRFENFSKQQVRTVVQEVYWGVYQLNSFQLVHLDLKVDNVLLKLSGNEITQVLITDFEYLRFIEDPNAYLTYGCQKLSPPELVNLMVAPDWKLDPNKDPTKRNLYADDAWRTAIIAWVCLMGCYPNWFNAFQQNKTPTEIQQLMHVPLFWCARTNEEELLEYALEPNVRIRPSVRDVLNFMVDNNWS